MADNNVEITAIDISDVVDNDTSNVYVETNGNFNRVPVKALAQEVKKNYSDEWNRLGTAEKNVSTLQDDFGEVQKRTTSLESGMSTANKNISALTTQLGGITFSINSDDGGLDITI